MKPTRRRLSKGPVQLLFASTARTIHCGSIHAPPWIVRETLALTGTKKGCDHGQCGACTVHVNGRRVLSCLNFAVMHDGHERPAANGLSHNSAVFHRERSELVANSGCRIEPRFCGPGSSAPSLTLSDVRSSLKDARQRLLGSRLGTSDSRRELRSGL